MRANQSLSADGLKRSPDRAGKDLFMRKLSYLALLGLGAAALFLTSACGGGAAVEWHPDQDGIGVWFDGATQRVMKLAASEYTEGEFDLTRFSLDPNENRMLMYAFTASGADSFTGTQDAKFTVKIAGTEMVFSGVYTDGSPFSEKYQGVGQAFIAGKIREAEGRQQALSAKKDPDVMEQQQIMVLGMIIDTLKGIKFPN